MKTLFNKLMTWLKNNQIFIVTYLCFYLIELTLRMQCGIEEYTIFVFISTNVLFCLSILPYFLFKKKGRIIYCGIIVFLYSLLAACQSLHYAYFSTFFSFKKAAIISEFFQVKGETTGKLSITLFIFVVYPLLVILSGIYGYKKRENKREYKLSLLSLILGITGLFVYQFGIDLYSTHKSTGDDYLYETLYSKPRAVSRLGFYQYEAKDLVNTLFSLLNSSDSDLTTISNYISEHSYNHQDNDYTGLFEGKNIILILAESLSSPLLNETDMPTLYKMSQEGINFVNHYAPVYQSATADSEFVALTGLLPSIDYEPMAWSFVNNHYPFALAYGFNAKGYKSTAFHGYKRDFYNRSGWMTNYGFDKFYGQEDLDWTDKEEFQDAFNWHLDIDTFTQAVDITDDLIQAKPFFDYIISVSGHIPYVDTRYELESYLYEVYEQKGQPSNDVEKEVYCYIAAQRTLDHALSSMLENLENRGLLGDTVIVVFGDHYAYGLSEDAQKYLYGDLDSVDKYKTPFIIYNSGMEPLQIDDINSTLDIYPTLCNLFNININDTLVIGNDMLSGQGSTVIFDDRSWLDNRVYYNATKDDITCENCNVTDVANKTSQINELVEISQLMIKDDYYGNN